MKYIVQKDCEVVIDKKTYSEGDVVEASKSSDLLDALVAAGSLKTQEQHEADEKAAVEAAELVENNEEEEQS